MHPGKASTDLVVTTQCADIPLGVEGALAFV
jgi:hypothetical protein